MANQRISFGLPLPVYVNETTSKQRIAPGVYVNETSTSGTNVTLTSVQGTGSVGTFSISLSQGISLTGVQGAGSVGTFGIAIGPAVNVIGVQGTGSVGTFGLNVSESFTLTGVQGTGSVGNFRTPALSITVADFTTGRIFQRSAGTYTSWNDGTKDIPLTGTYTGGPPTGIDATINSILYHCTNLVASGGTWSATVPAVPNGDGYTASIVDTDPLSSVSAAQTHQWGVGILIAALGQSNMQQTWLTLINNPSPDAHARYTNSQGWWVLNRSLTGTGPIGSCGGIETMTNTIRAKMAATIPGNTTPVGLLAFAIGGTAIATWQTGGTSWNSFLDAVTGVNSPDIGGDFEMAIWHQGESDLHSGLTPGTYYAPDLANILTQCYTQTGRSISTFNFGVAIIGNEQLQVLSTDANMDFVRTAQQAQAKLPGSFLSGNMLDFIPLAGGGLHFSAATYQRFSLRYANSILNQYGLNPYNSNGPVISSVVWPIGATQMTAYIQQNSGGTGLLDGAGGTGTSLAGFVISSTGGQTVSSTVYVGNTIVFTMSGVRGGGDTATLSYGGGVNPFGFTSTAGDNDNSVTYDNQAIYLGDVTGFSLQPTPGGLASPMNVGSNLGTSNLLTLGVG